MRVRVFELRLLAGVLTVLWVVGGGLVLVAYRPGGPIDLLVGVAALAPVPVAAAALVWPPAARSGRAFALIAWLAIAAGLLLVPSIGGVLNQILARGPQTLMPSLEAVYPWIAALAATSLFTGLGVARRLLGQTALRRRRLGLGVAFAAIVTGAISVGFGGVAVANNQALQDRPAVTSRFGPTDPHLVPPACDASITAGSSARLSLELSGDVDSRSIGSVELTGVRVGSDVRWMADVATDRTLGEYGFAAIGGRAWTKDPRANWQGADPATAASQLIDVPGLAIALSPGDRAAAENLGLEFVEGARTRHCRIATAGATFMAAFPEARWLVGTDEVLHRWRGELDFWVFGDGELGRISGSVSGDVGDIQPNGLQARVAVSLLATDRDAFLPIASPPS